MRKVLKLFLVLFAILLVIIQIFIAFFPEITLLEFSQGNFKFAYYAAMAILYTIDFLEKNYYVVILLDFLIFIGIIYYGLRKI